MSATAHDCKTLTITKTRTVTSKGKNAAGQAVESVNFYDKQ